MNMQRFDNWADYNNAVDEEYRYDRERQPWPVHYDASATGIDNDRSELPASQLRILFLPHGFALSASSDDAIGNIVACSMSEQGPVALLAGRVPFSLTRLRSLGLSGGAGGGAGTLVHTRAAFIPGMRAGLVIAAGAFLAAAGFTFYGVERNG